MTAGVGAAGGPGTVASEAVPCISLRTRRSLRAVHFHPLGAPLLLSAEVNETSVRSTKYCPPRHPTHFEPSFLGLNGIL